MPKPLPQRDPLSPLSREVLGLFADALAEVRFPDIDLPMLEAAAGELRSAQLEVERLEAELEAARGAVADQADGLTAQAQRALAYARVFAEADPELAARVAAIHTPASAAAVRGSESKKRGRPRKAADADASLFGASEQSTQTPSPQLAESAA